MDLQFVLDPYACAVYMLSYITNGQRRMSKLLETASQEANAGSKDILTKSDKVVKLLAKSKSSETAITSAKAR